MVYGTLQTDYIEHSAKRSWERFQRATGRTKEQLLAEGYRVKAIHIEPDFCKSNTRLQIAISLLHEAGLLAQVVRHPEAMRQSWADGSEPMNCGEAGWMMAAAAQELEDKIAAFLEPNATAQTPPDSGTKNHG